MARTIKAGQINERVIPEKLTKWMWVTDFNPTIENVRFLIKGGRARCKIENETFNTLKNQGYKFEHNYGHGTKGLNNLFAGVMLISFLLDQINFNLNKAVQACYERTKSYLGLWKRTLSFALDFFVDSWQDMYCAILDPPRYNIKGI